MTKHVLALAGCGALATSVLLCAACGDAAEIGVDLGPATFQLGGPGAATVVVTHAYRGILGREPDAGGLQHHSDLLLSGTSVVQVAAGLFGSAEFAANRSHLDASELTVELYRGILQRQPDPTGLTETVAAIQGGRRAERAAAMLQSEEFRDRFLGGGREPPSPPSPPAPPTGGGLERPVAEVVVAAAYRGILGRAGEPAGVAEHSQRLVEGQSLVALCEVFFGSAEFAANRAQLSAAQLADELYRGMLQRAPDAVGLQVTVDAIRAGQRAQRAADILASDELCERFLSGVGTCPGRPPAPPPPPPEPLPPAPPPGVLFAELLLRADGPRWVTVDGQPFDYRQAIPCCGEFEDGNTGWPVAVAPAWQEYTSQRGANVLHMRPGPFLADTEPDMAAVGGAYVEVNGKADLNRFNQQFFDVVSAWIYEAGERGMRVEIDLIDWWRVRHGMEGDVPNPWSADHNIQGADYLGNLGRDGRLSSAARAWLRKMVQEWGRFGNVFFQDGTEISLIPGYTSGTTFALGRLLRQLEAEFGYPEHAFGSNGDDVAHRGDVVDYVTVHGTVQRAPIAGKPTVLNEYNSTPAFGPEQWMIQQCIARASGTYMAYWRSWEPQTRAQMDASFELWQRDDCSFMEEGCFPPHPEDPRWGEPIDRGARLTAAINAAKAKIPKACGRDPIVTLKLVGYELRQAGYCADQWVDAIGIQAPDGLWEEWHLVAFGTGCWTGNPYITAWPFID